LHSGWFTAGVTCYICVNVSDNLVCNQFAIDRPCPQGKQAAQPTARRLDVVMTSIKSVLYI